MSGGRRQTQKADSRGGGFFLLPHCVLNSEAFRTASPRAIKVLLAICAKHNGFNNGRIGIGFRELADWCDCQNHAANNHAVGELVGRGLLAIEFEHPKAQRLSTEYRLTFMPTGECSATNDYLHWKRGDAGTVRKRTIGNFGVAIIATGKPEPVVTIATGEETSRCNNRNGINEKPPILGRSPVAITATHILQPSVGLPPPPDGTSPNSKRPLSAAPDPEELRERVQAVLDEAERGSQGQLAAMAAIRPAALSKFLHNSGSLNDASRIRLTLVLPRVATREAAA